MIVTPRKNHDIEILSATPSGDNDGVHSLDISVKHEIDSAQRLEWSVDGSPFIGYDADTNPDQFTITPLLSDGNIHVLTIREAGRHDNSDTIQFTSPVSVIPALTILDGESTVSPCNNGSHSVSIRLIYANIDSEVQYRVDGGDWVLHTLGSSPATLVVSGLSCDDSQHTIEIESINPAGESDSFTYTAPIGPCSVQLTNVSVGADNNGTYNLAFTVAYENLVGPLEYLLNELIVEFAPGPSPHQQTVVGLPSNGQQQYLTVRSKNDPDCLDQAVFVAPDQSDIHITSATPSIVEGSTYDVVVAHAWSGITGLLQIQLDNGAFIDMPAVTPSGSGNYTLEDLTPDGIVHTVTIRSKSNTAVFDSIDFQSPASCDASPKKPNDVLILFRSEGGFTDSYFQYGALGAFNLSNTNIIEEIKLENYPEKADTMLNSCPQYSSNTLSSLAIPSEFSAVTFKSDAFWRFQISAYGLDGNGLERTDTVITNTRCVISVFKDLSGFSGISAQEADIVVYEGTGDPVNNNSVVPANYRGSTENVATLPGAVISGPSGNLLAQIEWDLVDVTYNEIRVFYFRILQKEGLSGDFKVKIDFI